VVVWTVLSIFGECPSGSGIVSSVVAFSPDQQTIVSGCGKDIEVWQLSPVTMIEVSDPTA